MLTTIFVDMETGQDSEVPNQYAERATVQALIRRAIRVHCEYWHETIVSYSEHHGGGVDAFDAYEAKRKLAPDAAYVLAAFKTAKRGKCSINDALRDELDDTLEDYQRQAASQ